MTKDDLKNYAIKLKQDTGKFPLVSEWVVSKGFPCSNYMIYKLFGNYNAFRDYCGEFQLVRTQKISIDWLKINSIVDENNCWNWRMSVDANGYGLLKLHSKTQKVHRVSYELSKGEISDGLLVRHKCDNRKCCNPDHLELGTAMDNANDHFIRKTTVKTVKLNKQLEENIKQCNSLEEVIKFHLENGIVGQDNCLTSIATARPDGYYRVVFKYKRYYLHRLVLANKLNKDYDNIDITRHICNNKSCINPEHLIEGSRKDNTLDSIATRKNVKLDKEIVLEIKLDLIDKNFNIRGSKKEFDIKWASKLSVTESAISNIRIGKTWTDVKIGNG